MKKNRLISWGLTPWFVLCSLSLAQAGTFALDQNYSTIGFRIKHIMGHSVGLFKTFNGTIELNDKNEALKKIATTVDVASLDTRYEARDKDLRSEKFFNVEKFPQAKFVTKSVTPPKVTADLTLHGITKEITLDYNLLGTAMDQRGHNKVFLSLQGTINRKDFGIDYNVKTDDGGWLLGDDVELMIEFQGILEK